VSGREDLSKHEVDRLVARLRAKQDGISSRAQLRRLGVPRWYVQAELRARRWVAVGRQAIVLHNGPIGDAARRAAGAHQVGPRAALDGVTALQHRGATGLTDELVHVIAAKGSSPRRARGVRVHESRRFREEDVELVRGVRTVVAPVAAVHAALWSKTDKQASLMFVVAVQQRLATVDELALAFDAVRRHRRRRHLRQLLVELAGGVRSLGELDVAVHLRTRGLPEPDRQTVRERPSGRQYLDAEFDGYQVTLEVDGWQHDDPEHRLADLLRDLEQVAEGQTVLRLPLAAWRLDREGVLDRLEQVFAARGWRRPAA
jgi:very-short-patch-repair endonuclease